MPAASVSYQRTREMTIDELLLENRVVFLIGEINPGSAARIMMQMLYLEHTKKNSNIDLYINSPGGAVDDTLALYDTMRFLSSPVSTYCLGRAYSGAASAGFFSVTGSTGDDRVDASLASLPGNRVQFVDPLEQTGPLAIGQSPDSAASVAATIRGQNMTDSRAREGLAIQREQGAALEPEPRSTEGA